MKTRQNALRENRTCWQQLKWPWLMEAYLDTTLKEWLSSKSDWTICTSREYVWINHHQAIWGEQFKVCHDSVAVDWPGKHEFCSRNPWSSKNKLCGRGAKGGVQDYQSLFGQHRMSVRMSFPHLRSVQLFMNSRAAVGAHMWRRQTTVCPNESSSIFHNNCCRVAHCQSSIPLSTSWRVPGERPWERKSVRHLYLFSVIHGLRLPGISWKSSTAHRSSFAGEQWDRSISGRAAPETFNLRHTMVGRIMRGASNLIWQTESKRGSWPSGPAHWQGAVGHIGRLSHILRCLELSIGVAGASLTLRRYKEDSCESYAFLWRIFACWM